MLVVVFLFVFFGGGVEGKGKGIADPFNLMLRERVPKSIHHTSNTACFTRNSLNQLAR